MAAQIAGCSIKARHFECIDFRQKSASDKNE
jgi:hypothetical protein